MKLALLSSVAFAFASPALAAPAGSGQALERSFDALISTADQQQWLQQMSSEPNHVGSPHDKANAEMQLALFKQWGWDAHIEQFDVLYPTPISTTLELIAPERLSEASGSPPILLIHGDPDPMIPVDAMFIAADQLAAANLPTQWHLSLGLGHGVDNGGLKHGGLFLAKAFGVAPPRR